MSKAIFTSLVSGLLALGVFIDARTGVPGVAPKSDVVAPPPSGIATPQVIVPNTFYVVSYGGKCLDFGPPPQVTGAPVFIHACNGTIAQQMIVQEINDRHQVILRAGTKVIGMKRSTSSPVLYRGATAPKIKGEDVRAPLSPVSTTFDGPLELQDPSGSAPEQIFALDGDSIILAADRTRVVKVQGNRGANRTPLILGPRDLADAEFWTFVPTDKSNRKPTSGFVRVPQERDFVSAVQQARPGTVVEVDPNVSIDLSNVHVLIPEGVTIRSNRRGTNSGAELRTGKLAPNGTMLEIAGNDVRITELRLRGPSRSTDKNGPKSIGIFAPDSHLRSVVDHNDMSDWTWAAVYVQGGDESVACRDHRDPRSLSQNVRVARNFIHHNQMQNKGYGVVSHGGAFPLIDGNTFYSNRHAIAADGNALTKYRAWNNLVLSAAPLQDRWGPFNDHTHDFDVHGTGTLKVSYGVGQVEVGGFGGTGGQYFEIARNTFLGTNRENFDLRGEPCYMVEFHHNVSLRNVNDAVNCSYCGKGINKLKVSDTNRFNAINPTTSVSVGDFDGNGRDDLFLATGAAWYYAPDGKAEWRFLNAQTEGIGSLLFGDFDGDGRTDVFTQRGRDWVVSWAGASPWEKINESNPALKEFRIGDFDGDRRADVFYADGQRWWVSYGGVGHFTHTQDSSFRVSDLGFGDFNGDGKTDVIGAVSGQWMVSLSATGSWAGYPLRSALTQTMAGWFIADLNGNGRADVVGYGKVSYDGRSDWKDLPSRPGRFAAIGRFDVKPGADIVFFWNNDNHLGIQSSGIGPAQRHSTQHMR